MDLAMALKHPELVTPDDLRALLARHWNAPLYFLAPQIGIHPGELSSMLHGRRPLRADPVGRLLVALALAEQERSMACGDLK